ncbi:MAG: hypothetical protein AKCLJLPJ_01578 [Fimbriimonadales bacterium]|nr:hypothetical protein [Fimbriimonadales bacterium]
MVEIQHRIRRLVARAGETFTVGGNPRKALVGIVPPSVAARYAPQASVDAATRPILLFVVPDDDSTVATDTLVFDGRSLAVLKIVRRTFRGSLACKFILAH